MQDSSLNVSQSELESGININKINSGGKTMETTKSLPSTDESTKYDKYKYDDRVDLKDDIERSSIFDVVASCDIEDLAEDEPTETDELKSIWVKDEPLCVVLVPTSPQKVYLHWTVEPGETGYIHCNRDGCVLCMAKKPQIVKHLLPVYNIFGTPGIFGKKVEILAIDDSTERHSLRSVLADVLKNPKNKPGLLALSIICTGPSKNKKYSVQPLTIKDQLKGREVIEAFLESERLNKIDYGTIYKRIPNDHLAAIPEIDLRLSVLCGTP